MLKYLAILGMALVVFCAYGRADKIQQNGKQQPNAQNPPAAVLHQQVTGKPGSQEHENDVHADVKIVNPPQKDFYDKAPVWINLALAIVGVLGVGVALCSLRMLREQTNHVIASERAWLIAESAMDSYRPDTDSKPVFHWSITNKGKTVARLIEAQCVFELLNTEQMKKLPPQPVYHMTTQFNGIPLPPEASILQSANLIHPPESSTVDQLGDDVKVIQIGLFFLLAYGYVKYLDSFGNERESRFIEKYIWPNPDVPMRGFQPYLDASAEYAKCT